MNPNVEQALVNLDQLTDRPMPEFRDAIIEQLCQITDSKIAYFYATDMDEEHLTLLGYSKQVMDGCMIVDPENVYRVDETGLWGDAIRERQPIITNDYVGSMRPSKHGLPEGHVPVINHMNLPVFGDGRIVALVGVGNKDGDYDDTDAQNVSDLMHNIWEYFQEALWAAVF
jgi:two-component system, OmpR family, phosphate regulon sensor histidine kinase PhoR